MEPEVNQPGITAEKPSTDIPGGETKVSETQEQDINRLVQSQVDKRLVSIYQERDTYKQKAESLERDYGDLQKQTEELEADISRMQEKAYADDPELLKDAKSKRQFLKDRRDMERREKELKNTQVVLGLQMKALDIVEISTQYGVSAKVLERADVQNRDELEQFAREIASELKPGGKKAEREAPVYDRGISDVGGTTDEEFIKLYSEGKSDDHARANKILKV